jgi:hypothetical protein
VSLKCHYDNLIEPSTWMQQDDDRKRTFSFWKEQVTANSGG